MRKHYYTFDVLRLIFCLMIFIYHWDGLTGFTMPFDDNPFIHFVVSNGETLIMAFFTISGFCMAVNYRDRIAERKITLGKYAASHFFKFASMAIVTLPAIVLMVFWRYRAGLDTSPNILGFLLDILGIRTGYGISPYYPYNGPLWFCNVLFIVYIIYFAVCWFSKGRTSYVAAGIIITLLAVSQMAMPSVSFFILNINTFEGLAGFFMGVLIYEMYQYYSRSKSAIKRINIICVLMLIVAFIVLCLGLYWPWNSINNMEVDVWVNLPVVLLFLVWPPVVFLGAQIKGPSGRRGRSACGIAGRMATSIYIWHWPVLYIVYSFTVSGRIDKPISSMFCAACIVGATLVLAALSAWKFEQGVYKGLCRIFTPDLKKGT